MESLLMSRPNTALALLQSGDIEGLLDFHNSIFGSMKMTSPEAPPAAPAAPGPTPATDPNGVWAEGVQPPATPTVVAAPTHTLPPRDPATGQFTAEQMEQARREERDKLYGRLETMDTELQALRAKREADEAAAAAAQAEAEAAAEAARLAEMSATDRIAAMEQTWQSRFEQLEAQNAQQAAIFAQEQRLQGLTSYRDRRVAEESDLIHPTLVEYIQGASEDEIEASITAAKTKTDAIVQDMQGLQQAQRQAARGVAPTGAPAVGPMDTTPGQQSFSAEEIAAMDPATYAKMRPLLMQAASEKARAGGLYS